jgi:hypothetical protein
VTDIDSDTRTSIISVHLAHVHSVQDVLLAGIPQNDINLDIVIRAALDNRTGRPSTDKLDCATRPETPGSDEQILNVRFVVARVGKRECKGRHGKCLSGVWN